MLESIIREFIRTAEPVGSVAVVQKYGIAASPATIRNDMSELEEAGLIRQPHTSAGRIPTSAAYQFYVDNCLRQVDLPKQEEQALRKAQSSHDSSRDLMKQIAKIIADFSEEGVFLAFGKRDLYYTGLANLFSQPEFLDPRLVQTLSMVIDRLDEAIVEIFDSMPNDVKVFIGEKHSFGRHCSVIAARYEMNNVGAGIFGLLGPTRMDYDLNVARIKYVRDELFKDD